MHILIGKEISAIDPVFPSAEEVFIGIWPCVVRSTIYESGLTRISSSFASAAARTAVCTHVKQSSRATFLKEQGQKFLIAIRKICALIHQGKFSTSLYYCVYYTSSVEGQ